IELCVLALLVVPLTKWQLWTLSDLAMAIVALGAAGLPAAGIARGWRAAGRGADSRFCWLTATAAALVSLALALLLPLWLAPAAIAGVAAALLPFGRSADDKRIEWVATGFF